MSLSGLTKQTTTRKISTLLQAMIGKRLQLNTQWGKDDGLFKKMLESLNRRNGNKQNNGLDILIGETAVRNEFCLVTDDADLSEVIHPPSF